MLTRTMLSIMVVLSLSMSVSADTAFTYQGELKDGGSLANGSYNLDVSLWDALAGGSQIGSTVMHNGVGVVEGRFTLELDYGADALDNSGRWLEISVNGTELSPRTPITRAPYAIQTRGIFVDGSNNVGIGTTEPSTLLHIAGTNPRLTLEDTDSVGDSQEGFLSFVDGDGVETAWIGFVEDPAFYVKNTLGNIVLTPGGNDIVFTTEGRVGIGTSNPTGALHIETPGTAIRAEGSVLVTTNASPGVSAIASLGVGVYGESAASGGHGVIGIASASSGGGMGVYGQSFSNDGCGVYGYAHASTVVNYAVVGHSNSSSGFDFWASGAGEDYGSSSSRRWKSNIVNIADPLEKIARLRGVYFDWDEEHGGQHDVGMIAEEVGAVLPEIVNYEENGIDAIGMDYSKMTPLLVEAVKALKAENDSLRSRLDALESRVNVRTTTEE